MSHPTSQPNWRMLLRPRWLGWHLFAFAAVAGMAWLGDWQFRRAMAGNTLSWAYTFEWPIFAIFGVVFWVKTIRDELHPHAAAPSGATEVVLPGGATADHEFAPTSQDTGSADPTSGITGQLRAGQQETGQEATELAEYNAYLAKLSSQVKGHGRWHGLR